MTNEEIFDKAVQKAYEKSIKEDKDGLPNDFVAQVADFTPLYKLKYNEHYAIIFNIEFLKSYFGFFDGADGLFEDGERFSHFNENGWPCVHKDYRYHAPIMVIEENPLKYLEKFL